MADKWKVGRTWERSVEQTDISARRSISSCSSCHRELLPRLVKSSRRRVHPSNGRPMQGVANWDEMKMELSSRLAACAASKQCLPTWLLCSSARRSGPSSQQQSSSKASWLIKLASCVCGIVAASLISRPKWPKNSSSSWSSVGRRNWSWNWNDVVGSGEFGPKTTFEAHKSQSRAQTNKGCKKCPNGRYVR